MSGKILRMSGRAPALAPHEEAEMRAADLDGLLADDLTGPVGDAKWEEAQQQRMQEPGYWELQA